MDIGENLVGAYMRQVRDCHTVAYNTFLPWGQGEIDVIGVALAAGVTRPRVYLAEVATHLDGLNYGGYDKSLSKIKAKLKAACRYAHEIYPHADATIEVWAPIVPSGLVTKLADCGGSLIANDTFTARVRELLSRARKTTKPSGDDAFRLLQILTHLRDAKNLGLG
jgi:hypothetical protein